MTGYSTRLGRRPGTIILMALGLALGVNGQVARSGQPEQGGAPVAGAAPNTGQANNRSRRNGEDGEEEGIEIDPLLRMQLLSAILITNPDSLNTSTVTLTPGGGGGAGGGGAGGGSGGSGNGGGSNNGGGTIAGDPSGAPEPASLLLGAVGAGFAVLTAYMHRRRRRNLAAA